jgi:hypothetical protein
MQPLMTAWPAVAEAHFCSVDHEFGIDAICDRGTGYNFYDGTAWGEIAYERIESTRIGWPSIVHTAAAVKWS